MAIRDHWLYCGGNSHTICSVCDHYRKIILTDTAQVILDKIIKERQTINVYGAKENEELLYNLSTYGFSEHEQCLVQFLLLSPSYTWTCLREVREDYNQLVELVNFWTPHVLQKVWGPSY